tara:strand:- start:21748 stop:22338 length:591 start_codon:yes stop_codon:yes gene_type:complete
MQFPNGKDPFKLEIVEHLQNLGIKWILNDEYKDISWLEMVQDILNLISIVPAFEQHANPKIDQKIRDVLKCDGAQHNELMIDELNRIKPTYSIFSVSYMSCGCLVATGHLVNMMTVCDAHNEYYNKPKDSMAIWESTFQHNHHHSKNACMFRYPLGLSKNDDGSVMIEQDAYEASYQTALDNKQLNLAVDKLDWSD